MEELELSKQLGIIDELLDKAIEHGMEVEVIYFALKYAKEHPEVSPAEAFLLGITEWVK